MQRVLVTGAAGFAGQYLLEELLHRGITTFGTYYRTPPPDDVRANVDAWFQCDIRDETMVDEVVAAATPDGIIHLAAMSVPSVANANPRQAYDTNVRGWLNVVEAVRRLKLPCRLLLVSSSHVYGHASTGPTGFQEEQQAQPYDLYGTTRASSETIARVYGYQHREEIIIARAFNHSGPRQSPHYFVATMAKQIAEAATGLGPPEIRVGDLDVERDFTDVRDVVRAYTDLLLNGQPGLTYNVCSGDPVSLRSVVDLLQQISGCGFRVSCDVNKTAGRQPRTVFGDPHRLRTATGWIPTIPLVDTLEETLQYWLERSSLAREVPVPVTVDALS